MHNPAARLPPSAPRPGQPIKPSRLGISEEAIETAIKRGWTPDLLDKVQDPVELLLTPPDRDVFGLKVVK